VPKDAQLLPQQQRGHSPARRSTHTASAGTKQLIMMLPR
jgi:hypothetical protein